MKIQITSDHAGYQLKTELIDILNKDYQTKIIDLGTDSIESVDYPDFAHKLAQSIKDDYINIAICGTGQGMAITLNKYSNIRAALCWNEEIAILAKQHNNANVICLPARFITTKQALKIIEAFDKSLFQGDRHIRRIEKIPIK